MNEEPVFCEWCGHNSDNADQCTHCGHSLADRSSNPPPFRNPIHGRIKIRLNALAEPEPVWKDLAQVWDSIEKNRLSDWPSQLEKFRADSQTVELYGLDVFVSHLEEALLGRGVIEFQQEPYELVPWYDPNPKWYQEYRKRQRIPKNKRPKDP